MIKVPDFGIGVADCRQLKSLLEKQDIFLLEISGAQLEEAVEFQSRSGAQEKSWFVRELCPARVMGELPEASLAVKRDFLRFAGAKLESMAALSAERLLFRVDVARCKVDSGYFAGMKNILLNCCAMAERHHIRCGIEARIPGNFVSEAADYLKFRRDVGYPLYLQYDFHIHEPGSFEALEMLIPQLAFDRDGWRISFDMQSGNYLNIKMLQKFLRHVRPGSWESPYVIFSPGAGAAESDIIELERLWESAVVPEQEAQ